MLQGQALSFLWTLPHKQRHTALSTSSKLSISEFPSKYQQLQDPSVSSHSPAPGSVGMLLCAAHHTLQSSFRYTPTVYLNLCIFVKPVNCQLKYICSHLPVSSQGCFEVCHTAFCCLIIILKHDEQKKKSPFIVETANMTCSTHSSHTCHKGAPCSQTVVPILFYNIYILRNP